MAGNDRSVPLEAVENQELIEPLRQKAHPRGKRFSGVASRRLDYPDLFRRGQRRVLRVDETERIERGHEARIDGGRKIVGGVNEAIETTVQAHSSEAEAPLVAASDRRGRLQAVDLLRFDRRRLDAVDPVRTDGAGDRGRFRDRDAIEAQRLAARLAARVADADQRGRLIVEREALGRVKGETEFRMNEGVVTHHALGGIVAEGDAVYRGKIRIAADFAGPRRAELAGRCGRLGDALRRRRVGRHHVGAIGGACARDRSAKGAPLAKRGEEPSRAVGVVSGAGDGLDADLVSREFLRAGKAGDGELRTRLDFVLSLALG